MSSASRIQTSPRAVFKRYKAWFMLLPVAALLGYFFILPVFNLLVLGFQDRAGAWTLDGYRRAFNSPIYLSSLQTTLSIAFWTTVICVVVAYPVAYKLASLPPNRRTRLYVWVLIPLWTSILVRNFAWLIILGSTGLLNDTLQRLGFSNHSISLLYGTAAVLIGISHALLPLAIISMLPVMERINRNLILAASTMGARPGSSFWRIYFPLSLPGVSAAGLLVFITALGFFITPELLGSPNETMLGQLIIGQIQDLSNWQFGAALSTMLLVVTLAVFLLYDRMFGISALTGGEQPGSGRSTFVKKIAATPIHLLSFVSDSLYSLLSAGRAGRMLLRWIGHVSVYGVLGFLVLPALLLVPVSFSGSAFIAWPPTLFSMRWYDYITSSPQWINAAGISFLVATAAAFLSVLIGTPAAFAITRGSMVGKSGILAAMMAPLIVPKIITAVAIFYLLAQLNLVGTTLGLIIGHAVLCIPYAIITIMAVLKTLDVRLELAASVMGASPPKVFWHVTMPLIRSGLIAAFLLCFVTSLDELTIALFVTGGLFSTLPKLMWDDALLQVSPSLAAVSVLLLFFVSAVILLAEKIRSNES